jgi:RecB family exonuclease
MSEEPLTAKVLEAYSLCPMKCRLYHLGDPSHGMARRVDAARALHAAVKRALDECYRAGGPRAAPVARLAESFVACFEGRACADSREEEEYRAAGLGMLRDYHGDHLGDEATGVTVDVLLRGELEGRPFQAQADRREVRADGRLVYLRYTTARRPPTESALEADLQTGLLQLLAQQAEGRPVTIEVHALRTRRTLLATKPADPLEAARLQILALARAVREAQDFPTVRSRHCRWCHARGVCPAWSRR